MQIRDAATAKEIGISLIPQEFNLVSDLNVYENIFLGDEMRKPNGFLDRKGMIARTNELLDELNAAIDPEAKIQNLSVAQKQMVEIAKAIKSESRLLIMDEPTTVLTSNEIEILYRLMRKLKERGVTLVYISHKLKEVKAICDRVMVLRDGEFIGLDAVANLGIEEMARRMVGRELSQIFPVKVQGGTEIVFSASHVTVPGVLEDVSFELRRGEILGFSGLIGAGRTEVAETIIGLRKASAGDFRVAGKKYTPKNPRESVKAGIAYLSEDRQGSGILTAFDLVKNTTLVSLENYSHPFIDAKAEKAKTESYVREFNIKAATLDTRLEYLSGGNQQKVSLAKSMDTEPKILIVDEPTRGIDVKAKSDIYAFIRSLADRGLSVIFISSELEEIIGMCTRVIVMKEGRIVGEAEGASINEEEIMYFATGVKGGH